LVALCGAARAQTPAFIAQYGTDSVDFLQAMTSDGLGGTYQSGITLGAFAGVNAGFTDAWLGRFDSTGTALWLAQLGTTADDRAYAAASAGVLVGTYVGGLTAGDLNGTNAGLNDAWLALYDGTGTQLWVRQFGTSGNELLAGAAADGSGGVYVAGYTEGSLIGTNAGLTDAWLARYDSTGTQLWIRQLGSTAEDAATTVTSDGVGGVIVAGWTAGDLAGASLGEHDGWLARYDGAGNQLWIVKYGTSAWDQVLTASPDGLSGSYIGGYTAVDVSTAGADAWLAHFDSTGAFQWIVPFTTPNTEFALCSAVDSTGDVYVGGSTSGDLIGTNQGSDDAWVARVEPSGTLVWLDQLGTAGPDGAYAGAADGAVGVFFAGSTGGDLGGPSFGFDDAWVARYDGQQCASPTAYCTALLSSSGCLPSMASVGTPSISNPFGFTLGANQLEAQQNGLLFFGTTGQDTLPFFGGTLCVLSPLYRLSVQNSGGTTGCDGAIAYTLDEFLNHPTGGPLLVAGTTVDCQVWFRDPPATLTVGLANGLEFTICP
jgi:hypothetical protein